MAEYSYKDQKVVKVSSKRQFTIPKKYFDALRIGTKVICYPEGNKLVIEPTGEDDFWDFSTEILTELVQENYSGEELLLEFEKRKQNTVAALNQLTEKARKEIAHGKGVNAKKVFDELLEQEDV